MTFDCGRARTGVGALNGVGVVGVEKNVYAVATADGKVHPDGATTRITKRVDTSARDAQDVHSTNLTNGLISVHLTEAVEVSARVSARVLISVEGVSSQLVLRDGVNTLTCKQGFGGERIVH